MTLQRPESIDAALALLAEGGGTILAGGTDVYPALRDATPPERMIDVTGIEGLRDISLRDGIWRLGAATTLFSTEARATRTGITTPEVWC